MAVVVGSCRTSERPKIVNNFDVDEVVVGLEIGFSVDHFLFIATVVGDTKGNIVVAACVVVVVVVLVVLVVLAVLLVLVVVGVVEVILGLLLLIAEVVLRPVVTEKLVIPLLVTLS